MRLWVPKELAETYYCSCLPEPEDNTSHIDCLCNVSLYPSLTMAIQTEYWD